MRFNTALLHGDFRGDKNTGADTDTYISVKCIWAGRVLRHSRRYLIIWHLDFHTVELAIQQ